MERKSNGKLGNRHTFKYDDHGNMIEKSFESGGKLRRQYIYKFDNKGNLTIEKEYIYFQKDKEERIEIEENIKNSFHQAGIL